MVTAHKCVMCTHAVYAHQVDAYAGHADVRTTGFGRDAGRATSWALLDHYNRSLKVKLCPFRYNFLSFFFYFFVLFYYYLL